MCLFNITVYACGHESVTLSRECPASRVSITAPLGRVCPHTPFPPPGEAYEIGKAVNAKCKRESCTWKPVKMASSAEQGRKDALRTLVLASPEYQALWPRLDQLQGRYFELGEVYHQMPSCVRTDERVPSQSRFMCMNRFAAAYKDDGKEALEEADQYLDRLASGDVPADEIAETFKATTDLLDLETRLLDRIQESLQAMHRLKSDMDPAVSPNAVDRAGRRLWLACEGEGSLARRLGMGNDLPNVIPTAPFDGCVGDEEWMRDLRNECMGE